MEDFRGDETPVDASNKRRIEVVKSCTSETQGFLLIVLLYLQVCREQCVKVVICLMYFGCIHFSYPLYV